MKRKNLFFTRRTSAAFLLSALYLSALGTTACLDEGKFGYFDQAEVLAFGAEGELSAALVFADERRIQVTLAPNADRESVPISVLEISTLASTEEQIGDEIDLTEPYVLVVKAEDGSTVDWTVDPGDAPGGGTGGSAMGGSGMGGDSGGDCPSTVATYTTTGLFEITDTPLAAGDGSFTVGPGEIQVRIRPTGLGSAEFTILSYQMPQQFTVNAPNALSETDTLAEVEYDACGHATGSLSGTLVSWQNCSYGPEPPLGTTQWSVDDVEGGSGCLNDYHVTGLVTCEGSFCALSGVSFPINIDDLYPQPLNAFEFSNDYKTFSMRSLGAPPTGTGRNGVELPNKEPSRSWIGLDGTLVDSFCEPIPDCN